MQRYLLGDAYAAAAAPGPEPEPEPEQSAAAAPLRAVVPPPAEEILAADAREVAYQTGVSEADARAALARNGYEMVPAVMELNDQQRRSRG
jgi:NACalpha-BTF3-like transcription factor